MAKAVRLALGVGGESGEIVELIKKWVVQRIRLSPAELRKELGDLMWYIAVFCEDMEWSLEDILEENIAKLKARYPDGFSTERSINRVE